MTFYKAKWNYFFSGVSQGDIPEAAGEALTTNHQQQQQQQKKSQQ